MTYNDVMATTTVLDLADPAAAAAAIDALNDELAAVPALRPGMGEAVAGVASAVRATPLDRWTAADPYLALLVHRAVLDARAAADDGERDALRIALERLSHALAALAEAEARGELVPAVGVARIHAALGDRDRAFAWLERAVAGRSDTLVWMRVDPRFDALRGDPRFDALLAKIEKTNHG